MSRFKRTKIKSSKKSSVSIDEKIAALNKELGKTGMLSEMDTSNVYQTTFETPNPLHNAFKSLSHDGQPLGFSGADFNIFTEPIGGLKYSPPHPVTGERRRASSWFGIASGFGPVSANSDRQILWCFDQSLAGGFGSWFSLELTKGSNPFWGTWISTAFGTEMLVPYNSIQSPLSSAIKFDLDTLNINQFTEPETWQDPNNVQVRSDSTNDPSFLPIDIFKKFIANTFDSAQEGYEYLNEKAREFIFGTGFDTELDAEKDYEKNRKENRPEYTGNTGGDFVDDVINVVGDKLKDLGDLYKDVANTAETIKSTIDAIPTSGNTLMGWASNNDPDHPDYRKNDPTSPNYDGPFEVRASTEWKNEVGQQIKNSLPDKSDYKIHGQDGATWQERLNNSSDGKITLNDFEILQLSDKMAPGANGDMRFHTLFNSLPPSVTEVTIDKDGNISIESNYRFTDRDDVSSGGPLVKDWVTSIAEKEKTGKTYNFLDKKGGDQVLGQVHDININLNLNMNGGNKSNWPRKSLQKESYITEGVKLGHFDPEVLNVDIKDLRKGIMPEYPKKAPPEMIDGYSKESRLAPRVIKGEPTIKITKKDLAKFHKLKKSEIEKFMKEIKQINAYLQKNPGDLIHVQHRYPKNDPRLAQLNWKMDQMSDASSKYLDKNFKVNQTSFKLAQDRVKKNTALTNPDYIQKHYDELRGTIKPEPRINRKSPSRFFKKPKKKSSMEAINDKIKQLDKDLLI